MCVENDGDTHTYKQRWLQAAGAGHKTLVLDKALEQCLTHGLQLKPCVLCSGMRVTVSCIYLPRYLDHKKRIPVNVRRLSSLVIKEDNSAFEKYSCSYMISQHKMRFTYSSSACYIQPPVYQDTYAISQKQYHQWHSYRHEIKRFHCSSIELGTQSKL